MTIFFVGLALILFVPTPSFAQYKKKKKKTESENFTDHLWYGGSFGLGLSSSTFGLSLSPMVGYKLTNKFSVGARLPLDYTYAKLTSTDGSALSYNNLDLGLGAFTRHKLFKSIFAHAEYNHLWVKDPVTSNGFYLLDPEDPSRLLTEKNTRDEFNIGLGYSSGGRIGTEFMLLYNVLDDAASTTIPWSIRVGLNYKF